MAALPVVLWPDIRLKTVCTPVLDFGTNLQKLLDDMIETATTAQAVGLAAPQVSVLQTIMVIKVGDFFKEFINPVLEPVGTEKILVYEGCLSVPNYTVPMKRYKNVAVTAYNRFGEAFALSTVDGGTYGEPPLTARLQHEFDHLQGKTFMDGLSELKRDRAKQTIKKWLRAHGS